MASPPPEDAARAHPEVRRLTADGRYVTDAAYHAGVEYLRVFLAALYGALDAEEVDAELRERIVNRTVYGQPRVPLDRVPTALPQRPVRLRTGGIGADGKPVDGLGPLQPGDVVREDVPVRVVTGPNPSPEEKAYAAHVEDRLSMLGDPGKAWESLQRRLGRGDERSTGEPEEVDPPGSTD